MFKRGARLEHRFKDCGGAIELGEECYELKLEDYRCRYVTWSIHED